MSEITTLSELRARIAKASAGVADLARREPDSNWLFSILRQLEYVDGEAAAGRDRLDRGADLNFGLLASHYVDDVNPALAAELHAIRAATQALFGT